jgi:thymidylate kinase
MKEFLEKIFVAMNAAGISYVVLRNYESLPDIIIGEDIDLLVSRKDAARLNSILREKGFLIVPDILPHNFALFFDKKHGKLIKFDIVDRLAFGEKMILPFPACYEQQVLSRKLIHEGFCIPSVEDEIILLLLHCIGDKGFFKSAYKKRLQKLVSGELDTGYLSKCLSEIFGQTTSKNVVPWINKGEFENLVKLNRRVETYLLGRLSLESLLLALKILNQRVVLKLLGRRGLSIALLGPDGSGKSTLAEKIRDTQIFKTVSVYMGREQFVIPTRRILKCILGALKKDKRKKNGKKCSGGQHETLIPVKGACRDMVDVVRFVHDLMDLYVRYFLYNYLNRRKGFLVINDRYIYDMLLGGEKIRRLKLFGWVILRLFPAPDFVFLLDTPAKTMYARKGEHSVEYLDAMKTHYATLSTMVQNCYVIPTNRKADKSANEIIAHIWKEYYSNCAIH